VVNVMEKENAEQWQREHAGETTIQDLSDQIEELKQLITKQK
jgi:voltage-gated sodium channel